MKKIYIAGAGGMLGEAFFKVFSINYKLYCSDINVNEKWISYLDFRNYTKYKEDVLNFHELELPITPATFHKMSSEEKEALFIWLNKDNMPQA